MGAGSGEQRVMKSICIKLSFYPEGAPYISPGSAIAPPWGGRNPTLGHFNIYPEGVA